MLSFKHFITEEKQALLEKLITLGGQAYPKFGTVVILAGGAGSGKGFIKDSLLGVEGYTFDVDELKKMAAKTPAIQKRVKDELGYDLEDLSARMKEPEVVSQLHSIMGDYLNLDDRKMRAVYRSIMMADPSRKPNLIFDVTLKDMKKLKKISDQVNELGYDKKNIHIVWVINDIEVAKEQNKERDRVVPAQILVSTHKGASATMKDIVNMGQSLTTHMDGDIVFAFNKIKVDSNLAKSGREGRKIGMKGKTKGGQYLKDANYFYVKRAGKPVMNVDSISNDIKAKIASYVPDGTVWS